MKRMFLGVLLILLLSISAHAYTIGGAYASLVSCTWSQHGYNHGNIGTYNVNGQMYKIFFGSGYCQN